MTTFDQLYCRIMFKDSLYLGPYTLQEKSLTSNGLACWVA